MTFEPTATGTLVTLVHDQLDTHGPGWEQLRDGVGSDLGTNGGWPYLLVASPPRSDGDRRSFARRAAHTRPGGQLKAGASASAVVRG